MKPVSKILATILLVLAATGPGVASGVDKSAVFDRLAALVAAGHLDVALAEYRTLCDAPDKATAAHACFLSGQLLLRLNRPEPARERLVLALARAEALGESTLALYCRFHLGIADMLLGNRVRALELFRAVTADAHRRGLSSVAEQAIYEQIRLEAGTAPEETLRTLVADLSRHDATTNLHPDRLEIRRQTAAALLAVRRADLAPLVLTLLPDKALADAASPWLPLAAEARFLSGDVSGAIALLARAMTGADPARIPVATDILYADLLARSGQGRAAATLLQGRLPLRTARGREALAGTAGHILLALRDYPAAKLWLTLASRASDRNTRRQAFLDMASVALATGDPASAIILLRDSGVTSAAALRLLATAHLANGAPVTAAAILDRAPQTATNAALANLGAAIALAGNATNRAAAGLRLAIHLAERQRNPREQARALLLRARLEQPDAALATLEQARLKADAAGDAILTATAWHDLGVRTLDLGRTASAITFFRTAIGMLDRERATLSRAGDDRLFFMASHIESYRFLALALLAAGDPEAAWQAFDQALARGYREAVADRALASDPALGNLLSALDTAGLDLAQALRDGHPQAEIDRRHRAMRVLKTAIGARAGPNETIPPASLPLFTAALARQQTVAIQFLLWSDDKPGFAFVNSAAGLEVIRLGPSGALRRQALAFDRLARRPLVERHWNPADLGLRGVDHRREYRAAGTALRARLLDRARQLMRTHGAGTLLLIADGELAGFPFAALPLEEAELSPNPLCLGDTTRLLHALSAAVWLKPAAPQQPDDAMLAFGAVGARTIAAPFALHFADLPGTRLELDSIRDLFRDKALIVSGDAATPDALRARLRGPAAPRHLHLATHGFFYAEPLTGRTPGALLLAGPGRGEGAALGDTEIRRLQCENSRVMLSACETASGERLAGEGLLSLLRSFLLAGAESVTASLWRIGDRAGADYTARYYREILAGKTPPAAHLAVRQSLRTAGWWPSERHAFICAGTFR